jgi:uncharacterized surface protein with fasciclin (FAS1) repeats
VRSSLLTRGALLAAASTLAVSLAACGSDDPSAAASGSTSSSGSGGSAGSSSPASGGGSATTASQPFGSACAQVPSSGAGSFQGMSTAPVGTAASSNPVLSTLVQAVQKANLVDTLNTTQDITVLAPANPAFQAVPSDQLNALLADTPQLTQVLTHHVIPGRLSPDQLPGQHATAANDQVTVSGSGQDFTISGDQTVTGQPAHVICGNVQTANATVYIIDQVLKPQAVG